MESTANNQPATVYRLSYSLLAVLLLLTVGVSLTFYKSAAEKDSVKFNSTTSRLQTEIENKVNLYVTLLAGVRGFISTTPQLNQKRFASYVDSLNLQGNYPALLRVGYVQSIPASDLAAYRARMADDGYPNLDFTALQDKPVFELLSYSEPKSQSSVKAIGFDFSGDPERYSIMLLAAQSGKAAMSGRLKPIVESGSPSPVIAIFLPIYRDSGGVPGETAGYVYTSFTPEGFVADIDKVLVEKDIAIQIFDSTDDDANLLAESSRKPTGGPAFLSEQQLASSEMRVAGRRWVTRFSSLPSFSEHSAVGWTPMFFFAGTCFSFLVFAFTYRDATRRSELQSLTGRLLDAQKERQKLFEQEKNARVEAEEANRVKDEFLAIVSHELKTPLNTIAGWTTILRAEHLAPGTKETALRKIEKNLRLQAKMVEQILNFSQIMADNVPLLLASISASEVFTKAIASVEPSIAEKRVAFKATNDLNGEVLEADPERLVLALSNVLSNAVKFTPAGGRIEACAEPAGRHVRFIVEDNGSGIDPDFLPHVFEHYKQGEGPAVRTYGGLGLGLAMTKHIVEQHGGTVESASSGPGRGARFVLTLPTKPDRDRVLH